MNEAPLAAELVRITKRFPGITANDGIDLRLRKGEIHALLGENGAGKSTLMNILFGLYQPDEGTIRIAGNPVEISNPRRAIELGIGMVHQHFKLVQPFTVTENIILGMEPTKDVRIDYKTAALEVAEISRQYGMYVDPFARIEQISVGMQQRVEILKALYRKADILIFDEPTAVLTPQEIVELLAILKKLAREGKSIILITHKLKEIMEAADTVTVIRRGKVVETLPVAGADPSILAEKMVGRSVSFSLDKREPSIGSETLTVQELTCLNAQGQPALNGLSFTVRAGEILGIAGVDGNGQTELVEAITGLRKVESGSIRLNGRDVTGWKPRNVTRAGVAHIPEDRHKHGLVLDFTMSENLVLQTYEQPEFTGKGFLKKKAIDEHAEKLISGFDVRTPSIRTLSRALSGGNQQKAIIAREIDRDPDLLIAAQPTRGLDVGAIEFVHRQLVRHRDRGKAVLLVSFELDEILNVADRIAVIYGGRIVGEVYPRDTNDKELGLMMAGGSTKSGGSERG
ncbi:ABC transporter ATP-binding protein [Cohnella hongkongensis]|uniref:ABC transporter ATP-binding protein n=1 Tax=Cohnella hongkongensis TaxID=178337 RepID=A0ABV9FMG1_9BACL